MSFLREPEPPRGVATLVAKNVQRVVASNASSMTYHGTNSYLIDTPEGRYILDPGPAGDDLHFASLTAQAKELRGILLTHHHRDHLGLAAALREATGAPIIASQRTATFGHAVDIALSDGDMIAGLQAVATPGHASDHICFARADDGLLFSGDHVMAWNSSMVGPPDGDMAQYCASLELLLGRPDRRYLPGHGPALDAPQAFVQDLLGKRLTREARILASLQALPSTAPELAGAIYRKADPMIAQAALRNVEAHLLKLAAEGLVREEGGIWSAV